MKVSDFERDYPELYWHVAKGKICAGEPLYGAIITTSGGTEIGHGESDISAEAAFTAAFVDSGLSVDRLPEPAPASTHAELDFMRLQISTVKDQRNHYQAIAQKLRKALERIIDLDHHNMGPESRATEIARAALTPAKQAEGQNQ